MAFSTALRDQSRGYDHGYSSGNLRSQTKIAGAALVCIAFACAWTLWTNLAGPAPGQRFAPQPVFTAAWKSDPAPGVVAAAYAKLARALNRTARHSPAANADGLLFDARFLGVPAETFVKDAAIKVAIELAAALPRLSAVAKTQAPSATLPGRHQPLRLQPLRTASLRDGVHAAQTFAMRRTDRPTIFEKLFGRPSPITLAYAAPDDGGLGAESVMSGRYDRETAVYDIAGHTVYLPDGTALEAHSGYASLLDDPRYTDRRMRGATPATVYDLKLREGLFHGVQALRLVPLDQSRVFGRTCLLAHTFMLGTNGQSNGCVSFRDYDAFLHAYLRGKIKRLAVVDRLD
jgi:hypothetical protein